MMARQLHLVEWWLVSAMDMAGTVSSTIDKIWQEISQVELNTCINRSVSVFQNCEVLLRSSGPFVLRFTGERSTNNGRHQLLCFPFLCLPLQTCSAYISDFFLFFVQFGIINLDVAQMEAATLCEPEERFFFFFDLIPRSAKILTFFYPNCLWQSISNL